MPTPALLVPIFMPSFFQRLHCTAHTCSAVLQIAVLDHWHSFPTKRGNVFHNGDGDRLAELCCGSCCVVNAADPIRKYKGRSPVPIWEKAPTTFPPPTLMLFIRALLDRFFEPFRGICINCMP